MCDAHAAFSAPSLDEIRAYCEERRNGIDPQSFKDYYANRDWPKDWKAAIRRWETYERKRTEQEPVQTKDEADRAWSQIVSLRAAGLPWSALAGRGIDSKADCVIDQMIKADEIELKRPLADGTVQTIPNRQRFVELYRKEMMA